MSGFVTLRYRKNDPAHNVYVAVQRFIKANGGTAVVMGGIEVQAESAESFNYKIAVSVSGRRPTKDAADSQGKGKDR